MASTDKPDTEYGKEVSQPPQPAAPSTATSWLKVDVVLRLLLFAATVTSLVVLVTSKQTIRGPLPGLPVPKIETKFNNSPAFIYFLVALSVSGLYSIITTLASISVILKPQYSTKFLLHFVFWDVLILGILASATGTAGGVAYVGLKGNDHVQWNKVCNLFDKFCRHIGAALGVSLFASFLLIFLIWLNVNSLHKKIPK